MILLRTSFSLFQFKFQNSTQDASFFECEKRKKRKEKKINKDPPKEGSKIFMSNKILVVIGHIWPVMMINGLLIVINL